jgi:hypothetical protein
MTGDSSRYGDGARGAAQTVLKWALDEIGIFHRFSSETVNRRCRYLLSLQAIDLFALGK